MRLVLDTNEFIGALDVVKNPASEILLNRLIESFPKHTVYIPRTIINEVRRNLTPSIFVEFIQIIPSIATIDEDIVVPFEIGIKYEFMGLKPADAFIAAYSEWIKADALITENRHFLSRKANLPFKILTAENCLKILDR
ncbi:MAG: hypothetical protein KKD55_03765 [Candidatus Omnitrophica bacterium]|nr:hypothetical protein [Candidatus Omnitrophota bacterium]